MAASYSTSTKSTYVKIASYTVPSSTSSYTFTNIPQNFTDLTLVCVQQGSSSYVDAYIYVGNGSIDTGANYSSVILTGNGSAVSSTRQTSSSKVFMDYNGAPPISGSFNIATTNFMSYSSGSFYKTWLTRAGNAGTSGGTDAICGMWRNTAPINTIKVELTGSNYAAGTTFTLYGIECAKTPRADGGLITTDGAYWYHTFLTTGLFTPKVSSLSCDYLVVAGGGGGASRWGGGGGAGGYRTGTGLSVTGQTYTVTVGAGGAGGAAAAYNRGTQGANSSFSTITSTGGGAGGTGGSLTPTTGGSGGGGGFYNQNGAAGNAGSYSPVEGYAGGNTPSLSYQGAGGGGAGAAGSNVSTQQLGSAGGIGSNSVSTWASATGTGVSGYYAGGGGGGGETANGGSSGGAGGLGGGGRGGNQNGAGVAATVNTGGGGGGGGNDANAGASGGSGIVIVRYAV